MRIISGYARGKKLLTLPGLNTRPTLDRTREALFNILQQRVFDSCVLDIFAGSGALGLEAVSRGATRAVFVDNSLEATKIIKANVCGLRAEQSCQVLLMDFSMAIKNLAEANEKFDLIFLDPPYDQGLVQPCLELIVEFGLLAEFGLIVAETSCEALVEPVEGLELTQRRKYGKNALNFLIKRC